MFQIILMMLVFLIGSFVLGWIWIAIFWIFSFIGYIVACICSKLGIFVDVSGDRNIWYLFCVVIGISLWVYSSNWGELGLFLAILSFFSGAFMLFRSADTWKIAQSNW